MTEHITDDLELMVAELRFHWGLTPRCEESTGSPNPGPEDNYLYCIRFIDHERFGLDHKAANGAMW